MDSVRGVLAFVRTVEAGSLSAAARQLGVSTVSVSRNIQRLERELGVRLLNRTTRSIAPTGEGRAFYESTRQALTDLEAAHTALREARGEPTGAVRMCVTTAFAHRYVMPELVELRRRYPRVTVELQTTDRLADLVGDGFDFGVRSGALPERELVVRRLPDAPQVVCASPAYLRAHGTPPSPEALREHECIGVRSGVTGRVSRWSFRRDGETFEMEVRAQTICHDLETAADAALAGLGIAELPAYGVAPHIRAGRLATLLPSYAGPPSPLYVYYPNRLLSPRVRAVVQFLLEQLARHPDLAFDPNADLVDDVLPEAPGPGVTPPGADAR